jgi:hypothetical protein
MFYLAAAKGAAAKGAAAKGAAAKGRRRQGPPPPQRRPLAQ